MARKEMTIILRPFGKSTLSGDVDEDRKEVHGFQIDHPPKYCKDYKTGELKEYPEPDEDTREALEQLFTRTFINP